MFKKYFAPVDIVSYILIYFVSSLVGSGIGSVANNLWGELWGEPNVKKLTYIPIFLLTVIAASIYHRIRSKRTLSACLYPPSSHINPNGILLGIFLMVVISVVMSPIISKFDVSLNSYIENFNAGNIWITFLVTLIAAPILEEIFFRGILLRDMAISFGPRSAIFISSLIFAMFHFNLVQAIPAFFMGVMIGYIYTITHYSLWSVILIHFINNAASALIILAGFTDADLLTSFISTAWIVKTIYSVAVIIVVLMMVRIFTLKRHKIFRKWQFK